MTTPLYIPSFNGGEMSPYMGARVDHPKYAQSARDMINWIPLAQGPMVRRPGFSLLTDKGAMYAYSFPFIYSRTVTYIIQLASNASMATSYFRVIGANGTMLFEEETTAFPSPIVWMDESEVAGGTARYRFAQSLDVVYVADSLGLLPLRKISRLAEDDWTIETVEFDVPPFQDLPVAGDGPAIQIGRVTTNFSAIPPIPTFDDGRTVLFPDAVCSYANRATMVGRRFVVAEDDIRYDATDTVNWFAFSRAYSATLDIYGGFVTDEICAKRHILSGSRAYQVRVVGKDGELTPVDSTATKVRLQQEPSHLQGLRTYHTDKKENPVSLAYCGARYYSGKITAAGSYDATLGATAYTVEWDSGYPPPIMRSSVWAWAAVSSLTTSANKEPGSVYPQNVAIFRERVVLGNGQKIWGSVAGDYQNFWAYDADGEVAADMGFAFELGQGDGSPIEWMVPVDSLYIGTFSGIWALSEQGTERAFGPLNAKISMLSNVGTSAVGAVVANGELFYVQRGGRRIRRLVPGQEQAEDLSAFADHIGAESPIACIAWQAEPWPILWCLHLDGTLSGMTYDPANQVVAWHRHLVGSDDGDVAAHNLFVLPTVDGTSERLVLQCGTSDGNLGSVLAMAPPFPLNGDTVTEATYLDGASRVFSSTAVNAVTIPASAGRGPYRGLGDGTDRGDSTSVVDNEDGTLTVTFATSAKRWVVGVPYQSRWRPNRLELGQAGTSQGRVKNVQGLALRLLDTSVLEFGTDLSSLRNVSLRDLREDMDNAQAPKTADCTVRLDGRNETDVDMWLATSSPLPACVASIRADVSLGQ